MSYVPVMPLEHWSSLCSATAAEVAKPLRAPFDPPITSIP